MQYLRTIKIFFSRNWYHKATAPTLSVLFILCPMSWRNVMQLIRNWDNQVSRPRAFKWGIICPRWTTRLPNLHKRICNHHRMMMGYCETFYLLIGHKAWPFFLNELSQNSDSVKIFSEISTISKMLGMQFLKLISKRNDNFYLLHARPSAGIHIKHTQFHNNNFQLE